MYQGRDDLGNGDRRCAGCAARATCATATAATCAGRARRPWQRRLRRPVLGALQAWRPFLPRPRQTARRAWTNSPRAWTPRSPSTPHSRVPVAQLVAAMLIDNYLFPQLPGGCGRGSRCSCLGGFRLAPLPPMLLLPLATWRLFPTRWSTSTHSATANGTRGERGRKRSSSVVTPPNICS